MKSNGHIAITNRSRTMLWILLVALLWPLSSQAYTLVIDPGHGGSDIGAPGPGNLKESQINLSVAKLFGEKVAKEFKDVNIVYTRTTDTYITLDKRCSIANKAKGDLFISIHCNSTKTNTQEAKGAEVFVLGTDNQSSSKNQNLEAVMRENAVMTLEPDYKITYQGFDPNSVESYIMFEMFQNANLEESVDFAKEAQKQLVNKAQRYNRGVKQGSLWVLRNTSMPGALIELDFICNNECAKYLSSEDGQEQLADAIFDAFKAFRERQDDRRKAAVSASSKPSKKEQKEVKKLDSENIAKATIQPSDNSSEKAEKRSSKQRKSKKATATPQDSKDEAPIPATTSESPQEFNDSIVAPVYRVQFLVSNTRLEKGSRQLQGLYPVWGYRDGKSWKYTYGEASSWREAQKILQKVKQNFPDAFIIKTVGDCRM